MRSRLRTLVPSDRPDLADRLRAIAEAASLDVVDAPLDRPIGIVVKALGTARVPLGLDEVATVQALASEVGSALLVVVVPAGTDAFIRAACRRAGAFEAIVDGPDFDDDFTGVTHVARRVTRLELERERLVSELAHHDRLSTVGVLAAGVGHEINSPVQSIHANAETLRTDVERVLSMPRFQQGDGFQRCAGEWLDALGDTIGAARRITAIVLALNVFSRRTDESTEPRRTNLNAEVQSVLRLVGKEVRLRAHVDLTLAPDLPEVLAPASALTQVVSNLVINALQSLDGSVPDRALRRLRIETAADGESVLLQVSDNGAGIAPETLGRIFDPFFTTKPAGAGTGLGLSITRELVHRSGGEIFVESQLGRGATFRVVLPVAPAESVPTRPISQAPPPMLRHRVLIVDDDDALRRALVRSLQRELECVPEPSGEAALARVRAGEHFDAALLDVVLPGIDGIDTWRAIAAVSPELARRTVFLSGGLQAGDRRAALLASGQPVLAKPSDVATLLAALRTIVGASVRPPLPSAMPLASTNASTIPPAPRPEGPEDESPRRRLH